MPRILLLFAVTLCLAGPGPAAADDTPPGDKDRQIEALRAEVERLKAEVVRLQAEVERLRRAAPTPGTGTAPGPVPDFGGLYEGQETSREQMRFLLSLFRAYRAPAGAPAWPALDGKNLVLSLVAVGMLEKDKEGPLQMLFSPADKAARFPGLPAYAEVTSAALAQRRFPALTTYAGRRNAVKALAITPSSPPATTAVLADLSFPDGALVGFLDGKVRYVKRSELGLAPGDPIVAGPASRSPLLQTLSSE